jgi:hypothetical protein
MNEKADFANLLLYRGNEIVLTAAKDHFFLSIGVKINSNSL